jgi:hypothetical protein
MVWPLRSKYFRKRVRISLLFMLCHAFARVAHARATGLTDKNMKLNHKRTKCALAGAY